MTIIDKHIISFSGGKDSTALLLKMIENNMQIDEIIFCDTGLEFPELYEHISKVEKYINKPITVLKPKHSFEYYMFEHVKTKGKNKGKSGYGWPGIRCRWCTSSLKQNPINEYLRKYKDFKTYEYIGIAYNEKHRTNHNKNKKNLIYPLVEWQITEEQSLKYCYDKGFNWDGLYELFDRVSCYLCPLQGLKELRILYNEYPELWQYMKELGERNIEQFNRKFRPDYTIEELERKFDIENRQITIDEFINRTYTGSFFIERKKANR